MTVKILLVAREPAFRERLRLALERLEATGETVEFHEAGDGNEAIAVAERVHPDLVVGLGRWSGADALVNRPVDPFALALVARRLVEEQRAGAAAGA